MGIPWEQVTTLLVPWYRHRQWLLPCLIHVVSEKPENRVHGLTDSNFSPHSNHGYQYGYHGNYGNHIISPGVACLTAFKLQQQGIGVDGILLEAPFLSMPDAIKDYAICRFYSQTSHFCQPFLSPRTYFLRVHWLSIIMNTFDLLLKIMQASLASSRGIL